ncbi:single-stranded DNA-binding protein [Nocardia sp. NPDC050712]|uniref:single-stranded DNA-binding protein n=1 Tax=Actinomycetes TaxID=1760 RepID=UPI003411F363
MTGKTPMTITGNLCADIELRFTPNGVAVTNFTVASTPRHYNKQTLKWEDGETLFIRCRVWRDQAENMAESRLRKGTRVTVTGNLQQASWQDEQENKHTVYELEAEDVAASMRYAQVTVKRIVRDQQESGTHTTQTRGAEAAQPV